MVVLRRPIAPVLWCEMSWDMITRDLERGATIVDLYDACLYEEGVAQVATRLRQNQRCITLYLGRNNIGPDGAKSLSNALGHHGNRTLQALYLGGNRLGLDGAQKMADMLIFNTKLALLDLSHNNLGDDGATRIANHIHENHTLRTLSLASNMLTEKSVNNLCEGLCNNTALTTLSLANNKFAGACAYRAHARVRVMRVTSFRVRSHASRTRGRDGVRHAATQSFCAYHLRRRQSHWRPRCACVRGTFSRIRRPRSRPSTCAQASARGRARRRDSAL